MIKIRFYEDKDMPSVLKMWNDSVESGEVVFFHADEKYLKNKLFSAAGDVLPYTFVAMDDGRVIGFISGICQNTYLPGETFGNTPGYLTVILVDNHNRHQGVGKALLSRLSSAFKEKGKTTIACAGTNPINLDWHIPGTPGHDHNNAPGMDAECAGYPFLKSSGFADQAKEVAMYLNLSDYHQSPSVKQKQEKLAAEGIYTGRYDVKLNYDFDRMCDHVGSEYWRKVLQDETASAHPRPILVATQDKHILGFTGPVDKQPSGRGWFTGICTDPDFERRGIATVLFNLLMEEFILVGAQFSTLFTGEENHAQHVYLSAGFRPVRKFSYMKKPL